MKKILIIGKDSYIGKHLKNYLLLESKDFIINPISSNTETWKVINFSIYDCIIYLAEADSDCCEDENEFEKQCTYFNCDLVSDIAEEAKKCGVKRFVYVSTIDVYGKTGYIGNNNIINKDTDTNPQGVYARTKLEGENLLRQKEDIYFKIITLRLPLLYGPGCPGLYEAMTNILLSTNKVPIINNQLSVININTLCSYIAYLLSYNYHGTFHPQNKAYMNTTDLFKTISKELLIPVKFSKFQGWKYSTFKKLCPDNYKSLMGSLVYSKDIDM